MHSFALIKCEQTVVPDPEWPSGRAGVDYYFLDENGETFRVTLVYSPYFYIACKVYISCFKGSITFMLTAG